MSVFHCRCVSCAVRLGTAGWLLWDRNDVLPDDGPAGPKHVGVIFKINFNTCRRF